MSNYDLTTEAKRHREKIMYVSLCLCVSVVNLVASICY